MEDKCLEPSVTLTQIADPEAVFANIDEKVINRTLGYAGFATRELIKRKSLWKQSPYQRRKICCFQGSSWLEKSPKSSLSPHPIMCSGPCFSQGNRVSNAWALAQRQSGISP